MGDSTAPFHTFAPIRTDLAGPLADALEAANSGGDSSEDEVRADDSVLIALWEEDEEMRQTLLDEGCDLSGGRGGCKQSDSTLLLVALSTTSLRGNRLRPFDDGRTRDRLGRFPWGDANPLSYFRAYASNPDKKTAGKSDDSTTDCLGLVEALDTRLSEETRGHDRFSAGGYGTIYGWLDHDEVRILERLLAKGAYKVNADEPLDGGVADVARNLTMVLRAAQKDGAGIIHFSH
jgi:hypothetical protein